MKKGRKWGYFMNKRLIFGLFVGLLALGAVAHRFIRNDESVEAVYSQPQQAVQPKLTKSQKIQKLYQEEADPVGVIPVSFEQVEYDPIVERPRIEQSSVVLASAASAAEPTVVAKAPVSSLGVSEPMIANNRPEYAESAVQQPGYYNSYPEEVFQPAYAPAQSSKVDDVSQAMPNTVTAEQPVQQPDSQVPSGHYFKRSRNNSSYEPHQASSPSVVKSSNKSPIADNAQPAQEQVASAVPTSMFGRMKNMVSKVPKWLYALGLAGLYPFLKSKSVEDEPVAEADKQDVNLAEQFHDKLQEKMDEHINNQHNHDNPISDPVPTLSAQQPVAESVAPAAVSMDIVEPKIDSHIPVAGGMLSPTRKLLSPVRPMDVIVAPEQALIEPVIVEPQQPITLLDVNEQTTIKPVEHTPVVQQQQGILRSVVQNGYQYFAKRLQTPVGVLSLATKAVALGLQVGPLAYNAHQAQQLQQAEQAEQLFDQAIMGVAKKCHVSLSNVDVVQPALVQPVDAPGYAAQIGAGNIGAVVQQIAAKCAMLRLR